MTIRVYVASAYSSPDPEEVERNVALAIAQGNRIDALGFNAFVPHLFHHWDRLHPAGYERWMEKCLAELDRSDVLLRIENESPGASREVEHANAAGIQVVYSEEELVAWANQ